MRWFAVLLLLAVSIVPSTAAGQAISPSTHRISLVDLGVGVKPTAINNTGIVVGQAANGVAFKWQSGVTTNLGTLGGATSYANDVNDSGIVVGWSLNNLGQQKSFKWDGAMTNLDATTSLQGSAEAINNSGDIVGWRTNGNIFKSYLWDSSNPDGFLLFSADSGSLKALSINNAGEVVGVGLNNGKNGYYWNGSDNPANYTRNLDNLYVPHAGINNQGMTAGQQFSSAAYMAINDVGPHSIGGLLPTDTSSTAWGLNDLNQVVGESTGKGFIFDISSHSLLNINDFTDFGFNPDSILRLTDINNAGQFVGVATLNGIEHAFVGSFVAIPEPGTWAILVGGVLLVLRHRQRRIAC